RRDELPVTQWSQLYDEDAVVERVDRGRRDPERKPGLARAARPGQRQQAHVVAPEQLADLADLCRTADEPRRWCRQIRRAVVEGPGRGEVGPQAVAEQLEEAQRAREILEARDAEVAQLDALVQQRGGGLGEENLPAVAGVHHPGRFVDVEPYVAALRQ